MSAPDEPDVTTTTVATLQYALKRGIESMFQLEESELLAEPLPDRKTRHGVLFYEATEGGAGVLTRLVHDTDALARVARAALRIVHLDVPADAGPLPALDALHDVPGTSCVAGCYRCLLSYYNQPDHPSIDRRDPLARSLLLRLAAVQTSVPRPGALPAGAETDGANAAAGFDPAALGLPAPDRLDFEHEGTRVVALWRQRRVALIHESADPALPISKGLTCITWPSNAEAQARALANLRHQLT